MEEFFSPTSSVANRIQVIQMQTRVKLLRGDADVDHSQIIGGIYPPIPSGFGTPGRVLSYVKHCYFNSHSLQMIF